MSRAMPGMSRAWRSILLTGVVGLLLVSPALAGVGPTKLFDGTVSRRTATTVDAVKFTVKYLNHAGSPANWVRVKIGDTAHGMSVVPGGDWRQEVRFTWTGKLPVGKHRVVFQAMSRDRFADTLGAGSVTITLPPTPAPRSTPKPTPAPTPEPDPTATPAPRVGVDAHAASPTTDATGTATPRPLGGALRWEPSWAPISLPWSVPSGSPAPSPSDDDIALVAPGLGQAGDGGAGGGQGPTIPAGPGGSGSDGDPLGGLAAAAMTLGFGRPSLPTLGLATTLVTTSGLVAAAMAFGLFGKRRQDGEPPLPDDVLAENAGHGLGVATAMLAGQGRTPATVLDGELALPRWRRPSLLEARKADPIRDAPAAPPRLSFDRGLVGPLDGRERRLIRYNVVRLLDSPDELRGSEVGFLDAGDEVQLLERYGVYWLVLTPDGRQGWIHKMTLGEVVETTPEVTAPTATMPIAAETWTMGDDDIDGDVLAAYLENRRRA
jgi:hypothetical protein